MAKKPKNETPNPAPSGDSPFQGRVTSVDVQHALRASLQFEQADGSRTASYSSIEVLINMHIEIPPSMQDGSKFRGVIDAYAKETLLMVDERIKKDARRLGLVAITEQPKGDEELVSSGDLLKLDTGPVQA